MEDRGMKVSRQKTEYLCMGEQELERGVKIQGVKFNRVQEFKYLGSTMQSDGASNKEVDKRIQARWIAWRKITGLLCDRKVPVGLNGRIKKIMVRPAMLYGKETVAVTKGQGRKMDVVEMRMLLFTLGKTRMDKIWILIQICKRYQKAQKHVVAQLCASLKLTTLPIAETCHFDYLTALTTLCPG